MKDITHRLLFLSGIFIASLLPIYAADEGKEDIEPGQPYRVEAPFSSSMYRIEKVDRIEDHLSVSLDHDEGKGNIELGQPYIVEAPFSSSVYRVEIVDRVEDRLSVSMAHAVDLPLAHTSLSQTRYRDELFASMHIRDERDYFSQVHMERSFLQDLRPTFDLLGSSVVAGGPPPDPLRELLRYHQGLRESFERNFVRGNIQSFLEIMNDFRHLYFRDWSRRLIANFHWLNNLRLDLNFAPFVLGDAFGQGQDLENVMKQDRIKKANEAIQHIYDLFKGKDINEELSIQELQQYLEHLSKSDRMAKYMRPNGMNEVTNAMLTLQGAVIGYPGILEGKLYTQLEHGTPVTIKSLLAKSWWLITREIKDKEQELVKETLVISLGQCIEDDGRRVCDVGKSQRITTALQGYIKGIKIDHLDTPPNPQTFMSAFFTPRQEEIKVAMSKTPEEQHEYAKTLFKEAMQQAQQVYNSDENAMKEVTRMMKDFIKYSLDFEGDL